MPSDQQILEAACRSAKTETVRETALVEAWAKRRKWSRTESARWLNDRSTQLLAYLRRRLSHAPSHSKQIGYWLKEYEPKLFDRAHDRLAAYKTEADRDQVLIEEVLR